MVRDLYIDLETHVCNYASDYQLLLYNVVVIAGSM